MASVLVSRRSSHRSSWHACRRAATPPPLLASLRTISLSISHFASLVAAGAGATRLGDQWALDLQHKPPRDRLPMTLFARVVPAPAALGGGLAPVSASALDAPQLPALVPHAQAALVFVETSNAPVLPNELLAPHPDGAPADAATSELLYWKIVSTDSCEALHTGALLTLRSLVGIHGLAVLDDDDGSPIVAFGMVNALRIAPFVRHVMVPRAGCTVETAVADDNDGEDAHAADSNPGVVAPPSPAQPLRLRQRVRFAEGPREAAHGGALHQLVWCRTAAGRELVLDFTGPQYGEDDRLEATGTPFWSARLPERRAAPHVPVRVRGFDISEQVALFSEPQLPEALFAEQMHAHMGAWIRDSALAVLDHRKSESQPRRQRPTHTVLERRGIPRRLSVVDDAVLNYSDNSSTKLTISNN